MTATPLLTLEQAAAHLAVKPVFLRRLVRERRVRHVKIGKFVRFRLADLDSLVESGLREPL